MHNGTILIVEDEEALSNALRINLELENYEIITAATGTAALQEFQKNHSKLNLILLDVMLPEIDGFELCERFKKTNPDIPVIFLTAKNLSGEKISGLKLGAEDYITKPFELEELLLRIKNVIKRNFKVSSSNYSFDNCSVNFDTYEIKDINNAIHTLSKREIGLLKLLFDNESKVISRDEIINKLWDENENASTRTIDNYILSFRKYFEKTPKEPKHFHSIRGVGYKFTS